MAKKLPRYIFTNSKSTLVSAVVIVVLGGILLAVQYTDRSHADRLARLEKTTTAKVITIEENDNIVDENNVVVESYTIEYEFTVNDEIHYGRDRLEGKKHYQAYIRDILDSDFKQLITIKYDRDDPTVSLIVPPDEQ